VGWKTAQGGKSKQETPNGWKVGGRFGKSAGAVFVVKECRKVGRKPGKKPRTGRQKKFEKERKSRKGRGWEGLGGGREGKKKDGVGGRQKRTPFAAASPKASAQVNGAGALPEIQENQLHTATPVYDRGSPSCRRWEHKKEFGKVQKVRWGGRDGPARWKQEQIRTGWIEI